jgi:hypothetical protein
VLGENSLSLHNTLVGSLIGPWKLALWLGNTEPSLHLESLGISAENRPSHVKDFLTSVSADSAQPFTNVGWIGPVWINP